MNTARQSYLVLLVNGPIAGQRTAQAPRQPARLPGGRP